MIFIGILKSKKNWHSDFHSKDFLGFLKFLKQQKFSYKIIENLEELEKKPVFLILPSVQLLNKQEISAIYKYVASGGNLIATFNTSLQKEFQLKEIFGCSFKRKIKNLLDLQLDEKNSILKLSNYVCYDKNGKIVLRVPGLEIENNSGEIIANLLNENDKVSGSGIIFTKFKSGSCFYFSMPIGMALNNFTYTNKKEFIFTYGFPKINHFFILFFKKIRAKLEKKDNFLVFIDFIEKIFTKKIGYEYVKMETFYNSMKMRISEYVVENLLKDIAKFIFNQVQIPQINIWYWPENKRIAFAQRIDVDTLDIVDHYQELIDLCKKYKIKLSLFLNIFVLFDDKKKLAKNISILEFIKNHNHLIGTHGTSDKISHELYGTSINKISPKCIKNMLEQSKFYLKKFLNIECKIFAPPEENANEKVFEMAIKSNFKAISSGNIGCDGFPYFCLGAKKEYKLLNIPNSIADFYEEANLPLDFYQNAILKKWHTGGFSCLYFHPDYFKSHKQNIVKLWEYVNSLKMVWKTDLDEITEWWQKRDQIEFDYEIEDNTISIKTNLIKINTDFPISFAIYPKKNYKIKINGKEVENKEDLDFIDTTLVWEKSLEKNEK